jgi:thiol-disulfide isomerase/thioredoxin
VLALVTLVAACSRDTSKPHASAPQGDSTAMQPGAAATSTPTSEPNPSASDSPANARTSANEPTGSDPSAAPGTPDAPQTVTADRVLAEARRLGGKGTLVNAWASWCGPCTHEIPMLARVAADLAPVGMHVILVSLDEPGDHDKAIAFLKDRGVKLPLYFAERPLGAFKQGMNPRWPGMLPASFLFDETGRLRYFWGGEAFEEEIRPVLNALIDGKPIEGESNAKVAPEGEVH